MSSREACHPELSIFSVLFLASSNATLSNVQSPTIATNWPTSPKLSSLYINPNASTDSEGNVGRYRENIYLRIMLLFVGSRSGFDFITIKNNIFFSGCFEPQWHRMRSFNSFQDVNTIIFPHDFMLSVLYRGLIKPSFLYFYGWLGSIYHSHKYSFHTNQI